MDLFDVPGLSLQGTQRPVPEDPDARHGQGRVVGFLRGEVRRHADRRQVLLVIVLVIDDGKK